MSVQDCGKPWYTENYIAFFTAIRAKYPHVRLISNCDMGDHAPTDLFDWHLYTDSQNMFDRRHDFDNIPNIQDKQVFASEYGVVDDPAGTPLPFPGNARVRLSPLPICHRPILSPNPVPFLPTPLLPPPPPPPPLPAFTYS